MSPLHQPRHHFFSGIVQHHSSILFLIIIRTSIVTIVLADFFLSFAIWGSTTTVRITG